MDLILPTIMVKTTLKSVLKHLQKPVALWRLQVVGVALLGLGIGVGSVFTLSEVIKRVFASDINQSWDFSQSDTFSLSNSALVEVSSGVAKLKKQQYSSDSDTSLMLHYDEQAGNPADSSSNTHSATSTSTSYSTGIVNNGMSFDGNASMVEISDTAALSLGQEHSLESWMKLGSTFSAGSTSQRYGIFDKGDYQLYLDPETGKMTYELVNATANSWTQVAGTDLNSSWDLDGQLAAHAMTVIDGDLYSGLGNAIGDAEVWKWDGSTWTKIGGDGVNSSWTSVNGFESVFSMASYGDYVYAGLGVTAGDAEVWRYSISGNSWTRIGGDAANSSWALSTFEGVYSMQVIGGTLYAGLGSTAGDAEVWSWNGTSWAKIGGDGLNSSWNTVYEVVYSMDSSGSTLYVGLGATAGDAEVWSWNGTSWTKIGGDAVNSSWADATYEYVLSLETIGTDVYAAIGLTANDAEVWRFSGGTWSQIGGDSLKSGWTTNYEGVYKLMTDGTDLFAGLGSTAGDNELWKYTVASDSWSKLGGDALSASFTSTHTHIDSMAFDNGVLYVGLTGASANKTGNVWRYATGTWTWIGGDYINNSWGFRGLQNVEAMTRVGEYLYAGTGNTQAGNALIWRFDGTVWDLVGGQGKNGSWNAGLYEDVMTMISANGVLTVGLGVTAGEGEVWQFNGSTWSQIGGDSINSSWGAGYEEVSSLAVEDGVLYAGLGNTANDAEIWRYSGGTWTKIGGDSTNSGWTTNFERVMSLAIYDGKLFAGLGASVTDAEVWSWNGTAWSKVGGDGLNSSWNTEFEQADSMTVWDDKLIVGLGTTVGDAEVWSWNGTSWTKIGGDDVNSSWASGTYERVRSSVVYNGDLYIGLGNTTDGEIWRWNGSVWSQVAGDSLNSSFNTTIDEVGAFSVYKGKLYAGVGLTASTDAQVWSYGNNGFLQSATASFDTAWHHVAATYNGTTMKLFIDGALDSSLNVSVTVPDSSRSLYIGTTHGTRESGRSQGFFEGILDESRISDVARSSFITTPYSSDPQTIQPNSAVMTSQVKEFDLFSVNETANGGSISYRISTDGGSSWKYWNGSSWTTSSALNQNNSESVVNSNMGELPVTAQGFLWQAIVDGNGNQEVIIDDVASGASQDTEAPSNPETLTALSTSEGVVLTSDVWYTYPAPTFSWSGADDGSGSGVAGYYVYLGTDNTADPITAGVFQTEAIYTAASLTSSQTYYLRMKTKDNAQNNSSETWAAFTYKVDTTTPVNPSAITVSPAGYAATNSFTFTWPVGTDTGSSIAGYQYKTATASGSLADWSATSSATTVSIPNAAYQTEANTFYLRTVDTAGNVSSPPLQVLYYFAGEGPSTPRFVGVNPATNTNNSFAFSWQAPETFSGDEDDLTYCYTVNILPSENSCTFTSSGATSLSASAFATQQGINTFYIVAKNAEDSGGAINYGAYGTATFEANTSAPGIPLSTDVSDVSVKATESWKLALSWEPPASGTVSEYKISRSADGITYVNVATTTGIAYVDTGLDQQEYYYKVQACDNVNNCSAYSTEVSLIPDGKYTTAPEIVGDIKISAITTRTAIISWVTTREADSKVQLGVSAGSYFSSEPSNSLQKVSHEITLTNLEPGTTYYFKTKWTDEDGNTGVSDEKSFSTQPPPSVKDVTIKSVGLNNAVIQFTSTGASSAKIMYGETTGFGGISTVSTATSESTYVISLDELKDGAKYYYKVTVLDAEENEYPGTILSFETLPRPQVNTIRVQQVKGAAQPSALVSWVSNTPISSIVTYYPENDPSLSRDEVNVSLVKGEHRLLIRGLQPQTPYILKISGRDKGGNEAISETQRLTTATDTRPPQISNFRVVSSNVTASGSDQQVSQLIVSWDTDEPSTSQVEFGEGTGTSYQQKTQEDSSPTFNHVVVISNLTPSKVYHLRALSKDTAQNEGASIDTVTITSKASDNALNLVVGHLQQAFGFLNGLNL